MNNRNRNLCRGFILCLVALVLHGCAPAPVKQAETEKPEIQEKAEIVDVSPELVNRFNKAVQLMQGEADEASMRQAIELLKSVIAEEKRLPAPYINLAMAYSRTGDRKQAEANLISALKLEIGHPVANNELGLLYRKAGRFKAARVAYQNAIREHPDYLPARKNLGVLCDIYMHDYECALEQFQAYLERRPDDKTVTIWVADVKRRLK